MESYAVVIRLAALYAKCWETDSIIFSFPFKKLASKNILIPFRYNTKIIRNEWKRRSNVMFRRMCPFHCGGVSSYVVVEIERDKITIDAIQPRDDKFVM